MLTSITKRTQQGFTLIELMVVVSIIAILAAIAIPAFLKFRLNSLQAEARTNLGGIFVSQMSYHGSEGRFGGFPQIGFILAGSTNRYTYRSVSTDNTGVPTPQAGDVINASTGAITVDNSTYPAASSAVGFTATATANIDADPNTDEWYVNDLKANLQSPTTDDRLF